MRMITLPKSFHQVYNYTISRENKEKHGSSYQLKVDKWEELKNAGNSKELCAKYSKISRATYYRYKLILSNIEKNIFPSSKRPKRRRQKNWGEKEKQLVLKIRKESPTYGKEKIGVIINRDYEVKLSVSTVGRILRHLMDKGLVTKSISAMRVKRKRNFVTSHAKRWKFKKYEDMELGENVQIDHMTRIGNGKTIKHFAAWERFSKWTGAQIYSKASAKSAKKFLLKLIEKVPFKIKSIQVDGGSEFRAEFERSCQELGIPLVVLPPSSPKYNGGIERSNRIFKEEFYLNRKLLADSIGGLRNELKKAVDKYNNYRPHFCLQGLTPMEYINSVQRT